MMRSVANVLRVAVLCGIASAAAGTAMAAETDPSNPDRLPPPPPQAVGFPSRDPNLDALPGFVTPPPGYGEIPYWWWTGDPLDKERMLWQLEQLHAKGISGVQVNYAHDCTGGWPTYPAEPPLFSKAWWEFWTFITAECRKRGMGIGLSGYTLDWPGGKNLFLELGLTDGSLKGATLNHRVQPAPGGKAVTVNVPESVVSVSAYRVKDGALEPGSEQDLRAQVRDQKLQWTPPEGSWQVVTVSAAVQPRSIDPMNPASGRTVIEKFFQPFADHCAGDMGQALNYFFQDELSFGVGGWLWTPGFADEFRKRKGYDVVPSLPALFIDTGPKTPKVRLDYSDVMVALSEERYFRPIFDWHWKRGMIYACDPGSRGGNPHEFGDYFRCVRWYSAPGHDTPGASADLIKDKVSSSIAHLYRRPRVWLEGYHSLGWGATPATIYDATCRNFLYGASLLNLHGLYYTTHGGFWEWAPPCYHFRMPYWDHMGVFLKYFERLSYVVSQGVHRCDVAILYPVAPLEAGLGGREATQAAFGLGSELFLKHGIDFDFIDFESVARATVEARELRVAGEAYRVLVLPAMAAVRHSTLRQALAFYRAGGVVIATGCLPEASDAAGRDDPQLDAMVKEIFGLTAREYKAGGAAAMQTNAAGGVGLLAVEGAAEPAASPKKGADDRWAWSTEAVPKVFFKAVCPAAAQGPCEAVVKCDNEAALFVNGKERCRGADYARGWTGRLDLKEGDVLTIDGVDHDDGNRTAGLFVNLVRDGKNVLTESDFRYTLAAPDAAWRTGRDVSKLKPVDFANVHPAHKGAKAGAAPARKTPVGRIREVIDKAVPRDFVPDGTAGVLHRKIGPRDAYLVMGAAKNSECFFRAKGRVELWDPWTGQARPVLTASPAEGGTRVRMPLGPDEAQLIVFSPGEMPRAVEKTDLDDVAAVEEKDGRAVVTGYAAAAGAKTATVRLGGRTVTVGGEAAGPPAVVALEGPWEFELKPTLDNRFGDFRLPASPGLIGAEARRFAYADETSPNPPWQAPDLDDARWRTVTASFGARFWRLGPLPDDADAAAIEARLAAQTQVDPSAPVEAGGKAIRWQPYEFSWRWGAEGDPGPQGFHGLKENVTDDFILLGKSKSFVNDAGYDKEPGGTRYYLWTSAAAPHAGEARVLTGKMKPAGIWLNGAKLAALSDPVKLNAGANPLLLRFDTVGRTHVVLEYADAAKDGPRPPLSMTWLNRPGVVPYDTRPQDAQPAGWYRFTSPPGLRAMTILARGRVQAWAGGRPVPVTAGPQRGDGTLEYRAVVGTVDPAPVRVALRVEQERGCTGGAALPEPVALDCAAGPMALGDWSKRGVLETYSGGAWYRKSVTLAPEQARGRVVLNLGAVAATAEVHVNGKPAGIRATPPWRLDISDRVVPGENRIAILVYNTLANHYATIPTHYRGSPASGLLGPVTIEVQAPVVLK
jgi:hypothetical protein